MSGRSLVLWLADHQGAVLNEPGRDVVGTVAMRLPNAGRNSTTLRNARRTLGLGVGVDTEAWRNQCRPDHALRGESFRRLGYDARELFSTPRIHIDAPMTDSRVAKYAKAHLDAQLRADPTIFQTPGHVCATSTGWDNSVALAEATLDEVSRRGLREPAAGDPHLRRRSVFATLCLRPQSLDTATIRDLVDRFVRLPVDGYWVWAVGFTGAAAQTEQVLRLVLALQENSGRVACPGGMKHLWQAGLARGVAAAIAGPDRSVVDFDTEEKPPPPRDPEDEDDTGRQLPTYHGAVLGGFGYDERGRRTMAATFARNPCGCGHHPAGEPPQGRSAIVAHNQWWRVREARVVCVGSTSAALTNLGARLDVVTNERQAVGLATALPRGWKRSLEDWPDADIGFGAADGRAA